MNKSTKLLSILESNFKDSHETSIDVYLDGNKVKMFTDKWVDITRIFPKKYLDRLSVDEEDPTSLDIEVSYRYIKPHKYSDRSSPDEPADIEFGDVTAYLDKHTRFKFNDILDVKDGKYSQSDTWRENILTSGKH